MNKAQTCAPWVDESGSATAHEFLAAVNLLVKLVELLPHQQLLTFTPDVWVLGNQIG